MGMAAERGLTRLFQLSLMVYGAILLLAGLMIVTIERGFSSTTFQRHLDIYGINKSSSPQIQGDDIGRKIRQACCIGQAFSSELETYQVKKSI
jgi:hypothetical protein